MTKVKVEDYGDILALKYDGEKVLFSEEGGSYQGEYVAVIKTSKMIGYSDSSIDQYVVCIGDYGSCSGCDWLESEQDYTTGEVDLKSALEYANQTTALYILPEQPTQEWVDELSKKINS